ncbi:hypothetical protein [Fluviispira sanaruensis]|uniref:Uncharacterized protein n=1 Tax=Fluviispira sanaruensis TaxID=2493639 RepID=A0A4P2VIZ6_FLUSA|nr:hypothetical protein [Fluviispira sanaruensis]BBH53086.1 hypothetical protein JCM31447_15290 [Fluviispira sanaruensis]
MKTKNFEKLAKELLKYEQIKRANYNAQKRYQIIKEDLLITKKEMDKNVDDIFRDYLTEDEIAEADKEAEIEIEKQKKEQDLIKNI